MYFAGLDQAGCSLQYPHIGVGQLGCVAALPIPSTLLSADNEPDSPDRFINLQTGLTVSCGFVMMGA